MREMMASVGLAFVLVGIGYDLGLRSCAQAGANDVYAGVYRALHLLWYLVPLLAVAGLLAYVGGLLWLDYVRRSWEYLPPRDLPSQEGITKPSEKGGRYDY